MRVLYVTFGAWSGIVDAVTSAFRRAGVHVERHDPIEKFLYKARLGRVPVPNLRWSAVRGVAAAWARHGRLWKPYYLHTCYAFDRLTRSVDEVVRRSRPDAMLQAGVVFGPGTRPAVPYYLHIDHTRAISERYSDDDGLLPPIPFEHGWRERERAVYRGASAIFTTSSFVRHSLMMDYGVDGERVLVVGAGPNVAIPAEPAPGSSKAFLFVGLDFHRKGGPDLLSAFSLVREKHPDAELWIAGGYLPPAPRPGVRCHGRLGSASLAELYGEARAFVLPTKREPFGLVFLEAMAFALPCIGTRVEAVPEIVEHGVTGILVEPGDVPALAAAMVRLLEDPDAARAMGRAGRERLLRRYTWDRVARQMTGTMFPQQAARGAEGAAAHAAHLG